MKKLLQLTFLLLCISCTAMAQNRIGGVVNDTQGNTLPGASVKIKGTNSGTTTNANGQFSLEAPATATLIFTYTGFITQEIAVGNKTNFKITLLEDARTLGEVVVTALGIKKERKALGYSVTELSGDEFTKARETNVANSLVGKVAGLDIGSTSGGVGSATSIVIRGVSSLSQSNQPLFVVDGVPMENKPVGIGNSNPNGNTGSQWDNAPDLGDAIGNLNSSDIESISVLKGAAASALYGSRAKGGVIMITTKTAKGNSVEFSSNYVAEQVVDRTNWQYKYGQGANGAKPATKLAAAQVGGSSWGGLLDGSDVVQFDGISRPYIAQKNNIEEFYKTGGTWTNTLAFNKSFEGGGGVRFSASDLNSTSILPNSGLERQNFNLSGTFSPMKRLNIEARANYIVDNAKNRPMLSEGAGNANFVVFLPTSVDVNTLKPGVNPDGSELQYNTGNTYATNPWFAANNFVNNTTRNRLLSSANARYTFDNGLYLQGRAGQDQYNDKYKHVVPSGTAYMTTGKIAEQSTNFTDLNVDFLAGKAFKLNDLTITPNIGASYRNTKVTQTTNNGTDFAVFGVYNILNAKNKSVNYSESESETNSVYGTLEFDYKSFLYLTGTFRTDWFSSLATPGQDNPLDKPYPSLSGSFVFSEFWKPSFLNFGKLRAGYAVVGLATDPYQTQLTYSFRSESLNGAPLGSVSNGFIPNSTLKASTASELEVGTEMRMFNNRLSLDLTLYNKLSQDEITFVTTPITTGYAGAVLNAGEIRNKGVEVLLSGKVLDASALKWTSTFSASYNDNKVLSLAPGVDVQALATSRTGTGFLQNVVGKSAGQVSAFDYKYDASGNIVKSATGIPERGDLVNYGSAFNKYFAGWNNDFNYKNFNASIFVDGKFGGKVFSATDHYGYIFGLHQATLENRETLGTEAATYYTTFAGNVSKLFVQDASFIKLRQVVLGYTFPSLWNNRIQNLNVSFVARNLFILMKKTDNIDPESSYNATFPGLELGGLPPVRTFGLNLNVKF